MGNCLCPDKLSPSNSVDFPPRTSNSRADSPFTPLADLQFPSFTSELASSSFQACFGPALDDDDYEKMADKEQNDCYQSAKNDDYIPSKPKSSVSEA